MDINQQRYQVLTSEYVSNLSLETFIDIPTACDHSEKTATSMNDVVINMIEQVDETIYLRYLENLADFGPRVTGSEPCKAAAEYIYNQFDSMGLAVRYHRSRVDNVEATIYGTNESSDEIYIICAHYDTVSSSPGADDDASGTVAVLMA